MLVLKQQLALLVVGLNAANVLPLRALENGDEVAELLLELGTHRLFHLLRRHGRGERGNEGRRRGRHQVVQIVEDAVAILVREALMS